jgi:ATP-dependent RNA helicase DeaD
MSDPQPQTARSGPPPEPVPEQPTFDALPLSADVRQAIDELGYTHPTPVQLAVFEAAARGASLVVQARTGTGKTAAFGLPLVDQIVRRNVAAVQALILTPTRELALQVGREIENLGKHRGIKVIPVYGGAPMGAQIDALASGAQVVAGTPGRVLDHLRRGTLDPKNIRVLILDEADEMLSMGFAKELNAIVEHLPKERQGLFFSATIPPDVERLARSHLKEPEFITLSSDAVGALSVTHLVYLNAGGDKRQELVRILEIEDPESAIVFCNTKDETQRVCEALQNRGYEAEWLNGDLEQRERERIMARTREGKLRFLVATDVAARGIDVSHLTHVINADFPESAEQYVHRTGRTGRAGRTGTAISIIGPKDIGNLYILRLTYKIRPLERQLPTAGELKTRQETDLVDLFRDAFASRPVHPDDLALARRLLTHGSIETILAGLLRDHLGAREATGEDPATAASEARRAKNPPPFVAPPAEPAARPPRRDAEEEAVPANESRAARATRATSREVRRREERPREARADAATAAAAPPAREGAGRRRVPHSSFATWEPTAETDDDKPIFAEEAPRPAAPRARLPEPPPLPGTTETAVSDRGGAPSPRAASANAPRAPEAERERTQDLPGGVQLFVNVGRRDGARASDLQQMLEAGGFARDEIGPIRVRDRNSFVSVKKEAAERGIAALSGKTLGSRGVVAELARPRPGEA